MKSRKSGISYTNTLRLFLICDAMRNFYDNSALKIGKVIIKIIL